MTLVQAPQTGSSELKRSLGGVFFLALCVLLVNDHFLKHSHLLPGWLTGKLSDFAGLIVAPLVLIATFRAKSKLARTACLVGVSLPFVALKLSEPLTRALNDCLRTSGIPCRLWSDPTDLLALLVLPLAWRVSACIAPPTMGTAFWLERFGICLGAIGCLATSVVYDPAQTRWYLVSVTREDLDVSLYRVRQPLDCEMLAGNDGSDLSEEQFVFESCQTLEPFEPLLLDGLQDDAQTPACDAVLLRAKGLAPVVAFRMNLSRVEIDTSLDWMDFDDQQALIIEQAGQNLYLAPTESIHVDKASWSVPTPDCKGSP